MGVYQKTIGPLIAVPIRRLDPLVFFWIAALALLLIPGLDLPIRDWDEGIVARVAYERGQALVHFSQGELSWRELLLPTYWAEPYLNKPPGLHLPTGLALLSWAASGDLPPPWAVRLMPAFWPALWCRWLGSSAGNYATPRRALPSPLLPLPSPCCP